MRTKILIVALILTQSIFSQNENSRKIGDFTILKVYDLINIELVRAEENYAQITGQHSNNVVVKNKNGEFRIEKSWKLEHERKNGVRFTNFVVKNRRSNYRILFKPTYSSNFHRKK